MSSYYGKRVCCVCDLCGRVRWVQYKDYSDLCYLCAVKNRVVKKPDVLTEKRECVDDDITYEEKGYRSTWLKPNSGKGVWAVCLRCGKGRWSRFRDCRDLCHLCACKDDEKRKKQSEYRKGKTASDEAKKLMSDAHKGEKNSNFGKCPDDKTREKMRKNHADVSGENNPMWKGGISFEPYCEKFNDVFKEEVRERFERRCFVCNTTEEESGKKLCVHHVSYDKECMCNGVECEFVPLCDSCHSRTNGSRDLWERLIINVLGYEGRI